MPSAKAIEDKITTELNGLPESGKKEVLDYTDHLKTREKEKTLCLLRKIAGGWKRLVDPEDLKHSIYDALRIGS